MEENDSVESVMVSEDFLVASFFSSTKFGGSLTYLVDWLQERELSYSLSAGEHDSDIVRVYIGMGASPAEIAEDVANCGRFVFSRDSKADMSFSQERITYWKEKRSE